MVVDGAPLYKSARADSDIRTLAFGQYLEIASPAPGRPITQALVGDDCGFVRLSDVVTSRSGLRVSELVPPALADNPNLHEEQGAGNPLLAKVIVRNEAGPDAAPLPDELVSTVTRRGPGERFDVNEEIHLYDILRVFKVHFEDPSNRTWYLVGQQRLDPKGWIPQDAVIEWSHREAVYPARHLERIPVFADPQLEQGKGVMQDLIRVDEADPKRRVGTSRLPLLERCTQDDGGCPETIYTVATITNNRVQPFRLEPPPAGQGDSPQERTDRRAQIAAAMRQARFVDVLFVIDNTESMIQYREPVLQGIVASLAGIEEFVEPRFAFAVYGDYFRPEDRQAGLEQFENHALTLLDELRAANLPPFQINFLDFAGVGRVPEQSEFRDLIGETSFIDSLGGLPESAFAALVTAARGASWRREANFRLVIWVGDDGNRSQDVGELKIPKTEDPGRLDVDRVAAALNEVNAALVTINVKGRSVDGWNELLKRQGNAIAAQVKASLPAITTYDQAGGGLELNVVRDKVQRYVAGLFDISINLSDIELGEPVMDAEAKRPPVADTGALGSSSDLNERLTYAAWRAEYISKVTGVDDLDRVLKDIARSSEAVRPGFVRAVGEGGRKQVDLYLTMRPKELNPLLASVTQLCLGVADSDGLMGYFMSTLEDLTMAVLGDDRSAYVDPVTGGTDLGDFFSKLIHVPVEAFSLFEGVSIEEAVRRISRAARRTDKEEVGKFAMEVCRSAFLLNEIWQRRYIESDWVRYDGIDSMRRTPKFSSTGLEKEFEWLWSLEEDEGGRYFFVPVDFLPQHRG